ncbi:MAG: DMT family transporter [Bryobacteraceae bacterium]
MSDSLAHARGRAPLSARLLVLAAAALFSTGGAAIKALSFSSWQVASFRSGVAALAILLLIPEARRNWRWRYVPVAAAYALTLLFFVNANKLTTAANAIFLQAAAPLFVLAIGPLVLKEPIRRSDLLLMAGVASGMALFFCGHEAAVTTAPNPARGNVFGALSAVTYAITIAGLRWAERGHARGTSAGMVTVLMGNLLACAATLPMALPVTGWRWRDAAVIGWLGVFQIALAYLCLTRGIRHVPAFEATTLLLLEPTLNPVWTWLAHGERPAALSLLGGAVILSSTLLNSWWQGRRPECGD